MKIFTTATAVAALLAIPATAQAQFDGTTLLGSAIGAGLGGVIGSNLAGDGVQDEGTAIGAVLEVPSPIVPARTNSGTTVQDMDMDTAMVTALTTAEIMDMPAVHIMEVLTAMAEVTELMVELMGTAATLVTAGL